MYDLDALIDYQFKQMMAAKHPQNIIRRAYFLTRLLELKTLALGL